MYLLGGEWWPRKDPVTDRNICHACWNFEHGDCGHVFGKKGEIQCDHAMGRTVKRADLDSCCEFECDCVHLSEATFAAEETAGKLARKRERRKLEKTMLEADDNPLRADNPDFGKRYRWGA